MPEQPDQPLDPKPAPNEPSPALEPIASQVPAITPMADEGLPEWEPLTPELVEDEAIRGDFVIRWAVVGLALLLGVSQIAETRTLLHIKSGQYLASHGFLPPAQDPFSYTASERRWINLPWAFDLVVAGIHAVSGGIGLSLLQGLLACLTFGLLAHSVRMNIRTWWGSICATLALLVCYPQFTIQPELITLLGVSLVLWVLVRSEEPGPRHSLWPLVPLIWIWAQCDQRAWFGWFLLALWTVGEWLSREPAADGEKSDILKVTLASLAVVAVHPFLWESWLAPLRMYLTDYPAMRFAYPQPAIADQVFFPILSDFHWNALNHRMIAALVLAAATLVSLILNRAHLRWSHIFIVLGFNGMSLLATHELAAASLVNCVIGTINAQVWYREKFGQTYSIDWRELMFSRGGRAVTVIGFFALAWLILSGRIDGPSGKRTGVGFDAHLAGAMEDYQNLHSSLIDDHPFNFSMRQGDLMIWGNQKTFVDSRAGLFYGSDEANLLQLHNVLRKALRERNDERDDSTIWKSNFVKYRIRQACPRLNGPLPPADYHTLFSLLACSDFEMTSLNASTAVFIRIDPSDETATSFVRDHAFDVVKQAFRDKPEVVEEVTREYAKPTTTYDNLFSLRRPVVPHAVQSAQHDFALATAGNSTSNSKRCASALLAIRNANEGLRDDPNSTEGYKVLGMAYSILGQIESGILSQGGPLPPNKLRYYESISALQQALSLHPEDSNTIRQLLQQYESMGRIDVQLELLRKLQSLPPMAKLSEEEREQEAERIKEIIVQLDESVGRIQTMTSDHLNQGSDRLQVAHGASQAGGLLTAIKTLEEDAIYLAKNPLAKLALGSWLMEVGRNREAAEQIDPLEGMGADTALMTWRDFAAISALTAANYTRSIKLWNDQTRSMISSQTQSTMSTLPFLTFNPDWADYYPAATVQTTAQALQVMRIEGPTVYFQLAVAQMESGAVEDATASLRKALELNPQAGLRPLIRFYLDCLTGELIDLNVAPPEVEEFRELTDK
ncbi:tetratricopeptide repeat protein [Schlesneria paludicola]|uniref:tetratricopeptide repeat protein n=1 Tax=Schlesneria paludicola TaxID=360056 RepID=UPI00029B3C0E|nr:hypothetical protein [Schlesneria paludicola]